MPASQLSSANSQSTHDAKDTNSEKSANDDVIRDLLRRQGSMEEMVFSFLFHMFRDRLDIRRRYAALALLLEAMQLLPFCTIPLLEWGAAILPNLSRLSLVTQYFHVHNLLVLFLGYDLTAILWYVHVSVIACVLFVTAYVGVRTMNRRTYVAWPVRLARVTMLVFTSFFYVSSLLFLLMPLRCGETLEAFGIPTMTLTCWSTLHVSLVASSIVVAAFYVALTTVYILASMEPNPRSLNVMACPDSLIDAMVIFSKTVIVVLSYPLVQYKFWYIFCQAVLHVIVLYALLRFAPHYKAWVNKARAGLYGGLVWISCCITFIHFFRSNSLDVGDIFTAAACIGSIPAALLAYGAMSLRLRRLDVRWLIVRNGMGAFRFRGNPVEPFEAEIASRLVLRNVSNEEYVTLSEAVLRLACEQFPDSVYAHLMMCSFNMSIRNNASRGFFFLDKARRLHPSFRFRLSIYYRDKERERHSLTGSGNDSAADYVEFQSSYQATTGYHYATQRGIRKFWRLCLEPNVTVEGLSRMAQKVDRLEEKAERSYRILLSRYPKNVKLMRSYGIFLDNVRSDPWTAIRYFAEADKQETLAAQRTEDQGGDLDDMEAGGDSHTQSGIDDERDCICGVDQQGLVTFANKRCAELFGVRVEAMAGRTLMSLLSPASSALVQGILATARTARDSDEPADPVRVEALHYGGHTFYASLVWRPTQEQGGAYILVLFRGIKETEGRLEYGEDGTITACNRLLMDTLGIARATDVLGKPVSVLFPARVEVELDMPAVLHLLRGGGAAAAPWDSDLEGSDSSLPHRLVMRKQDGIECFMLVHAEERRGGGYVAGMTPVSDFVGMMSIGSNGTIVTSTATLITELGLSDDDVIGRELYRLMCPPLSSFPHAVLDILQSCTTAIYRIVALRRSGQRPPLVARLALSPSAESGSGVISVTVTHVPFPEVEVQAGLALEVLVRASNASIGSVLFQDRRQIALTPSDLLDENVSVLLADPARIPLTMRVVREQGCAIEAVQVSESGQARAALVANPPLPSGDHVLQVWLLQITEAYVGITGAGAVVYASPAVAAFFGKPADQVQGRNITEFIPMDWRAVVLQFFSASQKSLGALHEPRARREIRVLHTSGTVLSVLVELGPPLPDADKAMVAMLRITDASDDTGSSHTRSLTPLDEDDAAVAAAPMSSVLVPRKETSLRESPKLKPIEPGLSMKQLLPPAPTGLSADAVLQWRTRSATPALPFAPLAGGTEETSPEKRRVEQMLLAQEGSGEGESGKEKETEGIADLRDLDEDRMESEFQNNFDRARKYKNLVKVLNASPIHLSILALHARVKILIVVVVSLHIAAYAIWSNSLSEIQSSISRIIMLGEMQFRVFDLVFFTRALQSGTLALSAAADHVMASADRLSDIATAMYMRLGAGDPRRHLYEVPVANLTLLMPGIATAINARRTLFETANLLAQSGRLIAHRAQLGNLSSPREMALLFANIRTDASTAFASGRLDEVVEVSGSVSGARAVVGVLFAVQAVVLLTLLFAWLAPVLLRLSAERRRLFVAFLAIPRPVVFELARQTIVAEGEEENAGENEDDEWILRFEHELQKGSEAKAATDMDISVKARVATAAVVVAVGESRGDRATLARKKSSFWLHKQTSSMRTQIRGILRSARVMRYGILRYTAPLLIILCLVLAAFVSGVLAMRNSVANSNALSRASERLEDVARVRMELQEYELGTTSRVSSGEAILSLVATIRSVHSMLAFSVPDAPNGGLVYASRLSQQELLFTSSCLRTDAAACLPAASPYYISTHAGLDVLLIQFLEKVSTFVNESNHRPMDAYDMVMAIGPTDLEQGLNRSAVLYSRDVMQDANVDTVIQSIIFFLIVAGMYAYWSSVCKPFLVQVEQETLRIAMLLSMLPKDMGMQELIQ